MFNKLSGGSPVDYCLFALRKWNAESIDVIPHQVKPQDYKRNLAELGELIYKSIKPTKDKNLISIVTGSTEESKRFPKG